MAATFPGLKVLIYSGDQDIDTNPSFLTQTCLHELSDVRGNATRAWASWKVNDWRKCSRSAARRSRRVRTSRSGCADAGYVEYFERYAFATVAGAGHRVPENQPLAAVTMYERFIAAGSLDTSLDTE